MLQAIIDNAGTILLTLALAALVAWIILRLRRDRKQGKTSCGGSCGCCPMAGKCHAMRQEGKPLS